MINKITEKVSVNFIYNHETGLLLPRLIKWRHKIYDINRVGLHYTLYHGSALIHMFSVCNQNHYFLLSFNTQNLHWTLEEIADNLTN